MGGKNTRNKYLVTGGAGFIGSHLCEKLLEDERNHVFIIDDLSTGSIENIIHIREHPRFAYAIDSIMNKAILAELVDQVDIIFHLAASVGVRLIIESPVKTTSAQCCQAILAAQNSFGYIPIGLSCRDKPIPRISRAASIKVLAVRSRQKTINTPFIDFIREVSSISAQPYLKLKINKLAAITPHEYTCHN